MLYSPTQDAVAKFDTIPLWIAPTGTNNIEFDRNNMPTRLDLIGMGWLEINIGCTPERLVLARGGYHRIRLQYSLKHIGAIIINKSQDETLPMGLAVEVTENCCPWGKG